MCHKLYAADETRHNSIDSNAQWRDKPAATIFFISLLGHDVYENARTYGKFGRCAINRMPLMNPAITPVIPMRGGGVNPPLRPFSSAC